MRPLALSSPLESKGSASIDPPFLRHESAKRRLFGLQQRDATPFALRVVPRGRLAGGLGSRTTRQQGEQQNLDTAHCKPQFLRRILKAIGYLIAGSSSVRWPTNGSFLRPFAGDGIPVQPAFRADAVCRASTGGQISGPPHGRGFLSRLDSLGRLVPETRNFASWRRLEVPMQNRQEQAPSRAASTTDQTRESALRDSAPLISRFKRLFTPRPNSKEGGYETSATPAPGEHFTPKFANDTENAPQRFGRMNQELMRQQGNWS